MPNDRGKGLIPDKPDDRDFNFKQVRTQLKRKRKVDLTKLPTSIDLRNICSPIRDQGSIGSCSAFAIGVGLMESIGIEHLRDPFIPLSPLFLYYVTRAIMRTTKEDTGASMRTAMKAASNIGTCPEVTWPYNISQFTSRPATAAYKDTERFRIKGYYRVNDLDELKESLALKNPVALGLMLYSSFESQKVTKTGIVPMPNKAREDCVGGHALLAVGYKDGSIIIRNSWSDRWGDGGYCYVPEDYIADTDICMDMWTSPL